MIQVRISNKNLNFRLRKDVAKLFILQHSPPQSKYFLSPKFVEFIGKSEKRNQNENYNSIQSKFKPFLNERDSLNRLLEKSVFFHTQKQA